MPLIPPPSPQAYGASPHTSLQQHGGVPNASPHLYDALAHLNGTVTPQL